jgi:hypothetical protein
VALPKFSERQEERVNWENLLCNQVRWGGICTEGEEGGRQQSVEVRLGGELISQVDAGVTSSSAQFLYFYESSVFVAASHSWCMQN